LGEENKKNNQWRCPNATEKDADELVVKQKKGKG